jgi:hypothetical protein
MGTTFASTTFNPTLSSSSRDMVVITQVSVQDDKRKK